MKEGQSLLIDGIRWHISHIGIVDGEERVLLVTRCPNGHLHSQSYKLSQLKIRA